MFYSFTFRSRYEDFIYTKKVLTERKKIIKDIIRVLISDLMTYLDVLPGIYGMQNERMYELIEYGRKKYVNRHSDLVIILMLRIFTDSNWHTVKNIAIKSGCINYQPVDNRLFYI